jgi:wyosine [tRNA(Phe)-imidazoG37] synthetase (radical SAM superfamily)
MAASTHLPVLPQHRDHPRSFEAFRYAYPVLSRRAGGLSIGVNLNPDKRCNFHCRYCQVDLATPPAVRHVDFGRLRNELDALVEMARSGELYRHPRFVDVPPALREVRDIAFSGDAEPTTFKGFARACAMAVELHAAHRLGSARIVVITDGACLHLAYVKAGLDCIAPHGGEVWAKLDAGSEASYRSINRTSVPFSRVLRNLRDTAGRYPTRIQTLFMRLEGVAPAPAELAAYAERLAEIERHGRLLSVQLYTVARKPQDPACTPLEVAELEAIARDLRPRVEAPIEVFGG